MARIRLNASICATLGDATGRAAAPCQDARVVPAHILQPSTACKIRLDFFYGCGTLHRSVADQRRVVLERSSFTRATLRLLLQTPFYGWSSYG